MIIFCKPKVTTHGLAGIHSYNWGFPRKSRAYKFLWHKPQKSPAKWCSGVFTWRTRSNWLLSPQSLCMCGLSSQNLSLPQVHWVCERWEQKSHQLFWDTYPGFAGKPIRNPFLYNKPSESWPFFRFSCGVGILMMGRGVPRSLGKCSSVRLGFPSIICWIILYWP